VSDSTWTWISGATAAGAAGTYGTKGSYSLSNTPGARKCPTGWYDSNEKAFWLFGGYGIASDTESRGKSILTLLKASNS